MLYILLILLMFYLQQLECKFHESKSFCLLFIAVSAIVTGPDTVFC